MSTGWQSESDNFTFVSGGVPTIAFDESGSTGEDLLNSDQPVYVLSSVNLDEEVASRVVGPEISHELKFGRLRKSDAGRRTVLRILNSVELTNDAVKSCVTHKSFMVTGKIVEFLLEPLAAETGFDLYKEGGHLAQANVWHHVMPVLCSAETYSQVQASFVSLLRTGTPDSANGFLRSLDNLKETCSDPLLERDIEILRIAAVVVLPDRLSRWKTTLPDGSELDPGLTSLVALTHRWAEQYASFTILHDERGELAAWQKDLERLWNPAAEPLRLTDFRGREFRYPLPVKQLNFSASTDSVALQIADVIAGATRFVVTDFVAPSPDPRFLKALQATRVLKWVTDDVVWPSLDLDPRNADLASQATPFLADAMADWMRTNEND